MFQYGGGDRLNDSRDEKGREDAEMSLHRYIAQAKRELSASHLDLVSIRENDLELRGHNRNNMAILPTLFYGVLPLVGVFYFWNKEGAEIIVGLCALLFAIVIVVRVLSLVNTKMSFILYDRAQG